MTNNQTQAEAQSTEQRLDRTNPSLVSGGLWAYVHSRDGQTICFEFDYEGDETQFGEINIAQARELRDWLNKVLS